MLRGLVLAVALVLVGGCGEDPPAPESGGSTCYGRVVAVEAGGGGEMPGLDGVLRIVAWTYEATTAVKGGEFSVELPSGTRPHRLTAVLGGRAAWIDVPEEFGPSASPTSLVAVFPRPTILSVRDAETGAALDGVTVLNHPDWKRGMGALPPPPRPEEVLVAAGASPVEISPPEELLGEETATWFVGAPGRAFAKIDVDPMGGGERVVDLAPGGAIDVVLGGAAAPDGLVIRLTPAEEFAVPVLEFAPGRVRAFPVEGARPGRYVLSAEVDAPPAEPAVYASAEVEVRAGGRAAVRLELAPPAGPVLAPVAGLLVLGEGWGDLVPTLSFGREGRKPSEIAPGDRPGELRFRAALPVGPVVMDVVECRFSAAFEVPPDGREDVRIEVPAATPVEVRVVDEETGAPIEARELNWFWRRPAGGGAGLASIPAAAPGRFSLSAPPGEASIAVFHPGYVAGRREIVVGAEPLDIEIRMTREIVVVLELRHGDVRIPWSADWETAFVYDEAGEIVGSGIAEDGALHLGISVPGRHTIRFPDLPGFAAIPPMPIDARRGDPVRITVPLTTR